MTKLVRKRVTTVDAVTLDGISERTNDVLMRLEEEGKSVLTIDIHVLQGYELRYEAIIIYYWSEES